MVAYRCLLLVVCCVCLHVVLLWFVLSVLLFVVRSFRCSLFVVLHVLFVVRCALIVVCFFLFVDRCLWLVV